MQEALRIFRALGLQTGIANTLYALGALVYQRGDRAETLRLNQEALGIFRASHSRMGEAVVLCAMGWQSYMIGDYVESRRTLEDSLRIRRDLGDQGRVPHENLSFTLQALGQDDDARDHLRAALRILAQAHNPGSAVYMIISSAMLLARRGRHERAAQLAALALRHPRWSRTAGCWSRRCAIRCGRRWARRRSRRRQRAASPWTSTPPSAS